MEIAVDDVLIVELPFEKKWKFAPIKKIDESQLEISNTAIC